VKNNNIVIPFITMSFLLFLLGFITWMNGILVPFFKDLYQLPHGISQLVNAAFFSAYILSVPVSGFINKVGYKNSVVVGSIITGIGCILFIPSVYAGFGMFLFALFICAIGIVTLQVAVNPYIIVLGKPETSSSRLTLAMAINSMAAVLAPIIGSAFILSRVINDPVSDALLAKAPYLILGIIAFISGLIIFFMKLPDLKAEEDVVNTIKRSAWSYPHLILGFIGIGFYMGLEVGVNAFFVKYSEFKVAGIEPGTIGWYMALYPLGFFIGRLAGAGILRKYSSSMILMIFSVTGALLVIFSLLTSGLLSIWLLVATGLFHSIMWTVIFDLALKDVDPVNVKLGSGILCTGVVFTGLWTYLMGVLAERTNVPTALLLLILFYIYIIYYAVKGSKIRISEQ